MKKRIDKMFNDDSLPSKWKMRKRINTLENQVEIYENVIKDELFKEFMAKLGEPMELARLREENKNLRIKLKKYKEDARNGNSNEKRNKKRV